jgi:pyruvate dehydrogenase E2 component (dihydrolipoamide acetyltransferase)
VEVPITLALAAGDYMESATILRWLKAPGEPVAEGEPVVVVETAKASIEIPAPAGGVLTRVLFEEGSDAPIGQVLGWLEVTARDAPSAAGETRGRISASPAARRLAQQLSVDIGRVPGTGPGGQVRERDVQAAAAARAGSAESVSAEDVAEPPYRVLPESSYRKATVQSVTHSAAIPQFHLTVPLDMTAVVHARAHADRDRRPTITAMLVKAAAAALDRHPRLNAWWVEGEVRHYREINIGVAVGTADGLAVPIVHGADRLSLVDIDRCLAEKRRRAAKHDLTLADVRGGTFTISNLGPAGVLQFAALINPPQTAILAVGALHSAWSAAGGQSRLVPTCLVTLTADHRAMDGTDAASFLRSLQAIVQSPETWSG